MRKLLLSIICIVALLAGCESLDRVVTDDRVVTEDKTNITVAQKVVEEPQAIVVEETEIITEVPQQDKRPVVWPYVVGGLIIGGLILFALSRKRKRK